jgi:simple sugar transport system ATP-binding protein
MPDIAGTGGHGGALFIDGARKTFATPFDALDAGVGMVHQEFSLIPGFRADENILLNREPVKAAFLLEQIFGPSLATLKRGEMKQRATRSIGRLGVNIAPETIVSDMPVAHKQFTEIAREIDREAVKLLIMDEPTAVLTESEAETLLTSFRRLAAQGISIIFISHRLHEVIEVADRIIVLRDGQLIKNVKNENVGVSDIASWMIGHRPLPSGVHLEEGCIAPSRGGAELRDPHGGLLSGIHDEKGDLSQKALGRCVPVALAPSCGVAELRDPHGGLPSGVHDKEGDSGPKVSAESDVILNVENLWVDMPGERVKNISFSVREGEIFGIGGLEGSGKLGIPNGIMGLFPGGGTVTFDGTAYTAFNPRVMQKEGIAFVSEDRRGVGLLLDESLEWNISFGAMQINDKFLLKLFGGLITVRDEKAMRSIAEQYIKQLEIKCTGGRQQAKELSGGNQQKVCLAKAFALLPRLLFVSEPTRGIDVGAKKIVLDTLREKNRREKLTIVMISSELNELRSICDRIAIISEGKLIAIVPPDSEPQEFGLLMSGVQIDDQRDAPRDEQYKNISAGAHHE